MNIPFSSHDVNVSHIYTHSGKEDVLMNACCPGWVHTDMAGPRAPLTPDQGAETPVLCALLPPGSPTGQFWKDKTVKSFF